ncbi:hypothetical protein FE783_07515 [Paenibacillus mesophilus]|nr:hypothetical protein FE783_07515 [Paenibacillus mesophilus]
MSWKRWATMPKGMGEAGCCIGMPAPWRPKTEVRYSA